MCRSETLDEICNTGFLADLEHDERVCGSLLTTVKNCDINLLPRAWWTGTRAAGVDRSSYDC
jgi:hypothetical protein